MQMKHGDQTRRRILLGVTMALASGECVIGLAMAGLSDQGWSLAWPLLGIPLGVSCIFLRRRIPTMRIVALLPELLQAAFVVGIVLTLRYGLRYAEHAATRGLALVSVAAALTLVSVSWGFAPPRRPSADGTDQAPGGWGPEIRSLPGWSLHLTLLAGLCVVAAHPMKLLQLTFLFLAVATFAWTFVRVARASAGRVDLTPMVPTAAHVAALVALPMLAVFIELPLAYGSSWAYLGIGGWAVLSCIPAWPDHL
jgi:hypothetical protein